MALALPNKVYAEIKRICAAGNKFADAGQAKEAWDTFLQALALVPEPKTDWEATTWILASIGDMAFQLGQYQAAVDALEDSMHCPGAIGNPFIHLRLGESYFELDNERKAADQLARAYFVGGRKLFDREDPKYFALLERVLKPPKGHTRLP